MFKEYYLITHSNCFGPKFLPYKMKGNKLLIYFFNVCNKLNFENYYSLDIITYIGIPVI